MKNDKRTAVKINSKRDLKLYRKNPNSYKKMYDIRRKVKKITAFIGIGVLVFYGSNLIIAKDSSGINLDNKVKAVEVIDEVIDNSNVSNATVKEEIEHEKCDIFNVGSNEDKYYVEQFLQSQEGTYVKKYSEIYGVDPYIIAAMCMQETSLDHYGCIPGGSRYSGYGVGMMQLECPSGEAITCYNYETGEHETDYITMENACNVETNIKLGCMIFQNSLKNNNGNILLAIQSHNYGQGMIDCLLYDAYGDEYMMKKNEYDNVDWIDYVKKAHINPQLYVPNWEESKYGDDEYISHVLSHCPVTEAKYKFGAYEYTFDLANLKVTDMVEFRTKIM